MKHLTLLSICSLISIHSSQAAEPKIRFDRDIRPILADHCFQCHGPDEKQRKGKLRLDTKEGLFSERKSGLVVASGKPADSTLIDRITSKAESERMPPPQAEKQLKPEQIELLRKWIDQGAEYKGHWAFLPIESPELPRVQNEKWIRTSIDRFILARLEREGLKPSPEADKVTLIRRLFLDLTGLPPSIKEVDEFLNDSSDKAYENLVDKLLASPRYGERMALEWLDAARFADTHGYHIDSGRDMTHWREWVINAFNNNMPFDQFTVEQLAGDLLPNATLSQKIASGFNRNHMINFEGGAIPEEYHAAYIVDRVNTTSTVWMGLTLACAQCHDHKYDPFTQKDYYRLFAFFNNVPENGLDGTKGNAVPRIKLPSKEQEDLIQNLKRDITSLDEAIKASALKIDIDQSEWEKIPFAQKLQQGKEMPDLVKILFTFAPHTRTNQHKSTIRDYYRNQLSPTWRELNEKLTKSKNALRETELKIPDAMVMEEMSKPRDTFMLVRGQYDKKGDKVTAGTPDSLPPIAKELPLNRLGFAKWLVDSSNPLTSRVMVNRFWQMYFGIGLVKTSEDFGSQGEFPSHPDLLDWLAGEFRATKWDIKRTQKMIVMSSTYRQSSIQAKELLQKDPENRLLARMSRIRLNAEFIRDQALTVSGLLNGEIGGVSVSPYQPKGIWEDLAFRQDNANFSAQVYQQSHGKDLYRRTMYTFWKRTAPPPSLITFDAPDRETCTVRRPRTNTPLQALILMNDPTYVEASRKLAERMMQQGGNTPEERIGFAFRLVMTRKPSEKEISILKRVFDRQLETYRQKPEEAEKLLSVGESLREQSLDSNELAAWSMVASVILNLDEAITKN
jgi:hypothetical protein